MKAELISEEEMVGEDEVTFWYTSYSETEVCLNELLGSNVYDPEWIDEEHKFCRLDYSEMDGHDYMAIVNRSGQIVKKGIATIEEFIEDEWLFIVIISGLGTGEEAAYYMMSENDTKWAVINTVGDFVIPPDSNDSIRFDDEDGVFIRGDDKFTLNGDIIR